VLVGALIIFIFHFSSPKKSWNNHDDMTTVNYNVPITPSTGLSGSIKSSINPPMYVHTTDLRISSTPGHNCDDLINGVGSNTLDKSHRKVRKPKIDDYAFLKALTVNCTETYQDFVNYHYVSMTEKDFPISYEMLIYYKKPRTQQYIRLLKNLYRPHNYYCIHVDQKSPPSWTNLMRKFSSCFPNVIVTRKQIHINYGSVSILHAHLECFKELMLKWNNWKYVISLHGTELPLMTNREIINILKEMNGFNIITKGKSFSILPKGEQNWLKYKAKFNNGHIGLSDVHLGEVPYGLNITKSPYAVHSAFSYKFVQFILSNEKAIALREYLENVRSAEEFFFCTMNSLPEAPGGLHNRSRMLPSGIKIPTVSARDWMFKNDNPSICKRRKIVHFFCIASSSDLPRIVDKSRKKEWMFYNKYLIDYDDIVMDCIERELLSRNSIDNKMIM
jgi:hypothetical protein